MAFQAKLVFTVCYEFMESNQKSLQEGASGPKGGLVFWLIFGGLFLYAYLEKYGLVAGWLHAAAIIPTVFVGGLLYKAAPFLSRYFQLRYPESYWPSPFFKLARGIYPLTFFVMLYFWLQTRPDLFFFIKNLRNSD